MHKLIAITAACAIALGVSACGSDPSPRTTTKAKAKPHKLSQTARIKACLDGVGTVEHPSPEMLRLKTGGGFRTETLDAVILTWQTAKRADREAASGRADGLRMHAFGKRTITYAGRAANPSSAESKVITECVTSATPSAVDDEASIAPANSAPRHKPAKPSTQPATTACTDVPGAGEVRANVPCTEASSVVQKWTATGYRESPGVMVNGNAWACGRIGTGFKFECTSGLNGRITGFLSD